MTMIDHQTADDTLEVEQTSPTVQEPAPGATAAKETARSSGGADTPSRSIAKDDAFHVLQNARRRAVLRYLLDHPDQKRFRMRDLAEEVAAWEHDTTVTHLTSDERQRVYIALYQSHLPKLDEHGVIRYKQPRGIVEPTSLLAAFGPFLEDGLHAETQHLTLEPGASLGNGGSRAGLVPALSSMFTR